MSDQDEPPKELRDRPSALFRPVPEWARNLLLMIVFTALIIAIIALAYFVGRSLWGRASGLPDDNRFIVKLVLGALTERYWVAIGDAGGQPKDSGQKEEGHRKRKALSRSINVPQSV